MNNVRETFKRWVLLGYRQAQAQINQSNAWTASVLFRAVRRSLVHGLIEWGSESADVPLIIVGTSVAAVNRAALEAIVASGLEYSNAGPDFDMPVPGPGASNEDVAAWLTEFREFATVPWFSIIEPPRDVYFV